MKPDPNAANLPVQPRTGWYKRLFAWMMANSREQNDTLLGDRKRSMLGGLRGSILEIGPGTGPNLHYYSPGIHWTGVEPNAAMLPYIRKTARQLGVSIELFNSGSERLPAADASMDAVVSTHVLCSVSDLSLSLQEILRVLKPGGRFVFIEHVAAPPHTSTRRWQGWIRPAWLVCGDGCRLDRETWTTIEQAGFSTLQLEHFTLDAPLVGPHIAGVGVK